MTDEKRSPLRTRQRCCPHRVDVHERTNDMACTAEGCSCKSYSPKYGTTYIYCPECDEECPMGRSSLTHKDGCSLSDVLLLGNNSRAHAYRTEAECAATGIDYLSQPFFTKERLPDEERTDLHSTTTVEDNPVAETR